MADTQTPAPEKKQRPIWLKLLMLPLTIIGWLAGKLFKKGANITKALAEIPLQIFLHGAGVFLLVSFIYNPLEGATTSLFSYVKSNIMALDGAASFGTNFDLFINSFGWGFLALALMAFGGAVYVLNAARESFSVLGALIFIGILVGGIMALNSALPQFQLLTGALLHWVIMIGVSLFFGLGMCTSKLNKRLKGVIDNNEVED